MRTMALLLSIAGAAASCTEACGAVACGDGSCTATAFGHRMCADGGSCASTEDLFVEVYPSTSMCASDHVTMNFGVDYVTKNNLGGEGPDTEDEEMLRIDMIGTTSTGSYIALEIRALSAYTPNKADHNGHNGKFAQINLMTGPTTSPPSSAAASSRRPRRRACPSCPSSRERCTPPITDGSNPQSPPPCLQAALGLTPRCIVDTRAVALHAVRRAPVAPSALARPACWQDYTRKSILALMDKHKAVAEHKAAVSAAFDRENLIDVNNGDMSDVVTKDLKEKIIGRFLQR